MKFGLRTRMFAGVMLIVTLAVLAVGWLVRDRTLDAVTQDRESDLGYKADIYDELSAWPLYTGRVDDIEETVQDLASRTGLHIVVAKEDNEVIADSDSTLKRAPRVEFIIIATHSRRPLEERSPEATAACFAAAGVPELESIPERYSNFLDLVADIDRPQLREDDPFDAAMGAITDSASVQLKRCLSYEYAYDGEVARVFVGTGESNRFATGGLGPWLAIVTGVLGLAGVLAAFVSRRVTAPLRTLTSAVQQLASNGRTQRVAVKGADEVAELGGAFNGLTERIERAEQQRTQLVRDVAHELRNPLGVLQSQLEAGIDGVIPVTDESLRVMHSEVLHLTRLTGDLGQLAAFDAGNLRLATGDVDLCEIAHGVAENYQLAHPELQFVKQISPETVFGDGVRLRQVIANLVRNAAQHTPVGGTIRLSVQRVAATVVVEVSDSGTGMSPSDLEHVFDRMWRGDESRRRDSQAGPEQPRGAGLGLSICKTIVEAHGGSLTAQSKLGNGSTFRIVLPIRADIASDET